MAVETIFKCTAMIYQPSATGKGRLVLAGAFTTDSHITHMIRELHTSWFCDGLLSMLPGLLFGYDTSKFSSGSKF